MKLFLTAESITPNLVKPFENFIGKSSVGLKVAFIPDAGFKTAGDHSWIDEQMTELITNLHWQVDKITLQQETKETLKKLFAYDVIYANGGYSGYLAMVMKKSGFADLLPSLLKENIIYVGSSGGSMVLSKVQDAASFYFDEPEPEALEIGGLGLVDFEFYPVHDHLWTPDLLEKIKVNRDKKLQYFVVRDGQALSVEDGKIEMYGDVVVLEAE